jgi:hypothetical protein
MVLALVDFDFWVLRLLDIVFSPFHLVRLLQALCRH